ncbi:ABC transporter permease [Amphibiibacter pelophylacis]|uniref:ABC transporter permease n=1 Tax=Amphibiibacter pelophylacis TaxID=1799477 RepID=A0ACC6P297_9BURK
MQVLNIILRRLLLLVPLLVGIVLFVFIVMRFSPVDPSVAVFAEGTVDATQLAEFRHQHGLDRPLPVQFVSFLGQLAQGNMGRSLATGQKVSDIIATAMPLTIQLTVLGVLIAMVLSLTLGVTSAIYRDRWPDQLIRVITLGGVAAPSFWVALLLVQWLAIGLGLFPAGRYINPNDSISGWLMTMTLPALSLALPVAAQMTRIIRTSMVEELDRDYVRTARGGGLHPLVVVARNVLRNALINPLNVLGLRIGYLLGGAVVIETIFNLPGMGMVMINAVQNNEPAIVQGVVITIAVGFIGVNLLVDILSLLINPKLRGRGA